jgi:hypothetical protein
MLHLLKPSSTALAMQIMRCTQLAKKSNERLKTLVLKNLVFTLATCKMRGTLLFVSTDERIRSLWAYFLAFWSHTQQCTPRRPLYTHRICLYPRSSAGTEMLFSQNRYAAQTLWPFNAHLSLVQRNLRRNPQRNPRKKVELLHSKPEYSQWQSTTNPWSIQEQAKARCCRSNIRSQSNQNTRFMSPFNMWSTTLMAMVMSGQQSLQISAPVQQLRTSS